MTERNHPARPAAFRALSPPAPGDVWRLRPTLRSPDGQAFHGGTPSLAAVLVAPAPEAAPDAALPAAPVLPGLDLATELDLTFAAGAGLGFAGRVLLPAIQPVPLAALDRRLGRLRLPRQAAALARQSAGNSAARGGRIPPLPPGSAGLLQSGPEYWGMVESLGKDWRYLERYMARWAAWRRDGRVRRLSPARPAGETGRLCAATRDPLPGHLLADEAWAQAEFAGGAGILALCRRDQQWVFEIDHQAGLTVRAVLVDGHPAQAMVEGMLQLTLGPLEHLPTCLCLDTAAGPWIFWLDDSGIGRKR